MENKPLKGKNLEDIRPLKSGVKLKRKQPAPEKPKPEASRVIQNVNPNNIENAQPPNNEAIKIIAQLDEAKKNLIDVMKEENRLLADRKLSENRSIKEKENEQAVVSKLAQAALTLERMSPGEGLLGICILAIRQNLSLRDAGNNLAYEIQKIKTKVDELEKSIGKIESDIYEEEK